MRFTIISTKPGHQPPQSSCDFYAPGGTIGRGTDNNLVLPDNDRTISRSRHAAGEPHGGQHAAAGSSSRASTSVAAETGECRTAREGRADRRANGDLG